MVPPNASRLGARRLWHGVHLGTVLALAFAAIAAAATVTIDRAATANQRAERLSSLGDYDGPDLVTVYDIGDVDADVVSSAQRAAISVGGKALAGRSGSLGMRGITRSGATVYGPPAGWLSPMVFSALPAPAAKGVWGDEVASLLTSTSVVMNQLTATTMSVAVGDVVQMQAADGNVVALNVAAVKPYGQIGGADIVMSPEAATRLGATSDTRVVIWGFDSRDELDNALASVGLETRRDTKIARSWDPTDPDDTISTARLRDKIGDAWYRFQSDGGIEMHPNWISRNLTPGLVTLNPTIPVRARCQVKVAPGIQAALAEVQAAGLANTIDVADTNRYGGCWNPRFSRTSGQIGFLSRHAYGEAIDINVSTNCQGCTPTIDCRVVRIFRRNGFAWGGNFRRPDGMHFEWVGERRDQISYPSKYCPNIVNAPTNQAGVPLSEPPTDWARRTDRGREPRRALTTVDGRADSLDRLASRQDQERENLGFVLDRRQGCAGYRWLARHRRNDCRRLSRQRRQDLHLVA